MENKIFTCTSQTSGQSQLLTNCHSHHVDIAAREHNKVLIRVKYVSKVSCLSDLLHIYQNKNLKKQTGVS